MEKLTIKESAMKIRADVKAMGLSNRDVSIRIYRGSVGAIKITVNNIDADFYAIKATGIKYNMGNYTVSTSYSDAAKERIVKEKGYEIKNQVIDGVTMSVHFGDSGLAYGDVTGKENGTGKRNGTGFVSEKNGAVALHKALMER